MSNSPIGLYVHVPFCLKKCDYCAFASAPPASGNINAYLVELSHELTERVSPDLVSRISTVFVGGGNPTAIGPEAFGRLTRFLAEHLRAAPLTEWTFETNPETLTSALIPILRDIRCLRLSIGAQRLQDDQLSRLGRQGSVTRLREALDLACSLTSRVGIDLILGVPGCPPVTADVAELLTRYSLEHISAYFLSAEPETPLGEAVVSGMFPDPADIGPEELFELADLLQSRGFEQYEISNFAKSGGRCRHNLGYWEGLPYIGLGPSAVGTMNGLRHTNPVSLRDWLQRIPPEVERITSSIEAREYLMLRLRLVADGLDLNAYEARFGPASAALRAGLRRQTESGHIEVSGEVFRLTRTGLSVANRVIADLFED
ncbi:MAG: coproporphyrinogen-III oxidase family protein [Candidatus Ozemobacteraceae bacterium]